MYDGRLPTKISVSYDSLISNEGSTIYLDECNPARFYCQTPIVEHGVKRLQMIDSFSGHFLDFDPVETS